MGSTKNKNLPIWSNQGSSTDSRQSISSQYKKNDSSEERIECAFLLFDILRLIHERKLSDSLNIKDFFAEGSKRTSDFLIRTTFDNNDWDAGQQLLFSTFLHNANIMQFRIFL